MNWIKQKHKCGCASACLAMILNCSYEKALSLMHPNRKRYQSTVSSAEKTCKTLKRLNIKYSIYDNIFSYTKISNLAKNSIVIIQLTKTKHAVVWDASSNKILDPLVKKPKSQKFYQERFILAIQID